MANPTSRSCSSCLKSSKCVYKFSGPCEEWKPNAQFKEFSRRAKLAMNKPVSDWEREFLSSCSTRKAFTSRQVDTLLPILERVGV